MSLGETGEETLSVGWVADLVEAASAAGTAEVAMTEARVSVVMGLVKLLLAKVAATAGGVSAAAARGVGD